MSKSQIILVAAGTGGHINAAKSLGHVFKENGFDILYFTGRRKLDKRLFQGEPTIFLKSESLRNRSVFNKVISIFNNVAAFFTSLSIMSNNRPKGVIGAGGYICGPVLMAAFFLGIPIYIIEQNSVMGLTNKLLAFFANKIFINFEYTKGMGSFKNKLSLVGNPINRDIRLHNFKYKDDSTIKILVVGGSLGALEINNFFKHFLEVNDREGISIRHQTGIGKEIVTSSDTVKYCQLDYIDNMFEEYDWADLIVCRAGASTLSELRFVQKPVVLIPYQYATDDHQTINAKLFQQESKFSVYIYSGKELEENNFKNFNKVIDNNVIDKKIDRIDYSKYESTEKIIYKECCNDF